MKSAIVDKFSKNLAPDAGWQPTLLRHQDRAIMIVFDRKCLTVFCRTWVSEGRTGFVVTCRTGCSFDFFFCCVDGNSLIAPMSMQTFCTANNVLHTNQMHTRHYAILQWTADKPNYTQAFTYIWNITCKIWLTMRQPLWTWFNAIHKCINNMTLL